MLAKILLIDDDPETLKLIHMILKKHGYDLQTASSGREGLELAEANVPDLVLLDVMMPDMDGYEVCRRFRANSRLNHVPIIMFTAKAMADDKATGFLVGADDYLTKPTRPQELLDRIEMLLSRVTTHDDEEWEVQPGGNGQTGFEGAGLSNQMIAVLGVRGGAGTTTAAVNLACSLAESGYETLLADLDLAQGHVGMYLNQKVGADLYDLTGNESEPISTALPRYETAYRAHLSLLPCRPNLAGILPAPPPQRLADLASALARWPKGYVVADLGRGVTSQSEPFVRRAGQVILCLRPERIALKAARQLLKQLRPTLLPGSALHLLMLNFGGGYALPRAAIEQTLGHPLLDIITISARDQAQAVNRGLALVHAVPESEPAAKFRAVVAELVSV